MMTVLIGMITNCYSVSSYSGDGRLTDNGPGAATDRYVLDLGTVNLDKQNTQIYHIKDLPVENFVICIQINAPPENRILIDKQAINSIMFIELIGPNHESLISVQAPLNTWTWSSDDSNTAYIYRRNKPDTYFTPIKNGQYKLKVEIVQPDSSTLKYVARLLMKSGGWK